jgi:predicted nucleotidyltransferase
VTCLDPDQINEWAEPPGRFMLSWTDAVLREALQHADRLRDHPYEVFLQGSYANGTTIRQSSDVDLVVLLKLPFEENVAALDDTGLVNFAKRYEENFYGWEEFREDVLASLREQYFVHEGDKCVDIRDWDSLARVPADILPAIEYRWYSAFPQPGVEIYEEGVFFRDSTGTPIVNFPKQHLRNGNAKDLLTAGRFKQVVRVAKHARRAAAADSPDAGAAPSYFVECLFFNVPDDEYRVPLPKAYCNAVTWLDKCRRERPDEFAGLFCQNGLVALFGDGPDQWSAETAGQLIEALRAQ